MPAKIAMTDRQVASILQMLTDGYDRKTIAGRFGCGVSTIHRIKAAAAREPRASDSGNAASERGLTQERERGLTPRASDSGNAASERGLTPRASDSGNAASERGLTQERERGLTQNG